MDPAPGNADEAETLAGEATAIFIDRNSQLDKAVHITQAALSRILRELNDPEFQGDRMEANTRAGEDRDDSDNLFDEEFFKHLSEELIRTRSEFLLIQAAQTNAVKASIEASIAYGAAIEAADTEPSPSTRATLRMKAAQLYYDSAISAQSKFQR